MRQVKIFLIMLVAALSLLVGAGMPRNATAETVDQLRQQAEQGDADAPFYLGRMYYMGQGVPKDYQEALKWFRLAAERGIVQAPLILGGMYCLGEGVPRDYVEGYAWLIITAESGTEKSNQAKTMLQMFQQKMTASQIAAAQQRAKEIQTGLGR